MADNMNDHVYIHLADFLKTNLMKFAVISVKKPQKARFLSPTSAKIIAAKEKERSKRKSEEKERRRRKKSNDCPLSFYNSFFGDKKLLDAKRSNLAITLSKIPLDIHVRMNCKKM